MARECKVVESCEFPDEEEIRLVDRYFYYGHHGIIHVQACDTSGILHVQSLKTGEVFLVTPRMLEERPEASEMEVIAWSAR